MARTPLLQQLLDTFRRADRNDREERTSAGTISRRHLLGMGAVAGAALATGCAVPSASDRENVGSRGESLKKVNANIGIVGTGIAGLSCAYELQRAGNVATLHEASTRPGGRMWSMGPELPGPVDWLGQTIERGGELIDTSHKTIIGYANKFGLSLEDIRKGAPPQAYYFDGQAVSESTLVDQYRAFVSAIQDDLRKVGSPTATSFTPDDQRFDFMSLDEYLATRGAAPQLAKLLKAAYAIEYGLETDKLSSLAFIQYIKASRASHIRLFGTSDERYHVIGGNEQIPRAIAAKLGSQIKYGRKLLRIRKLSDGRVELTLAEGNKTITAVHDAVVLALPFNLIRDVQIDASVGLPDWKKYAIQNIVYGANTKLMVGFVGRPWIEQNSCGEAYSDQPYLQNTWETDPKLANATRGVLTDYTGAGLARSLSPSTLQKDAQNFLSNLDKIYPGAAARARRDAKGNIVCHMEAWPLNPLTKGAYTANQCGYFTTIADNEAPPVGNLYFAGETTSGFYMYQGFMEGGAQSGIRAAGEIVKDFG